MNRFVVGQNRYANRILRLINTTFLYIMFGFFGLVVGLFAVLPVAIFLIDYERRIYVVRKINHYSFKLFTKSGIALGVFNVTFHNAELLTQRGQLIIANHPSLLDIVFLIGEVPHINCVVKKSVLMNPFLAMNVYFADYILNDDQEQLLKNCADKLKKGESLIIFPEGTRTTERQTNKFKRGAAYLMLMSNCPARPVHISCEPPSLGKHDRWYIVPEVKIVYHLRVFEELDITEFRDSDRDHLPLKARNLTKWLMDWYRKIDGTVVADTVKFSNPTSTG